MLACNRGKNKIAAPRPGREKTAQAGFLRKKSGEDNTP